MRNPCRMFHATSHSSIVLLLLQWLLLQGLLFQTARGAAGTYYFFCEVDKSAVVTLEWNEETMAYELPGDGTSSDNKNNNTDVRRVKRTAWKDSVPVWVDQDPGAPSEMTVSASQSSFLVSNDPLHRH